MGFLTIKEYDKLNWVAVGTDYYIKDVIESEYFYDFICVNKTNNFTSVIGLTRKGEWSDTDRNWEYHILWNGMDTTQWVTADWIGDKDNMIQALMSVTEERKW